MQRLQTSRRTSTARYSYLDQYESDTEDCSGKLRSVERDWNAASQEKTIFPGASKPHEALQANGSRTPIGQSDLHVLSRGDHIGWHRPYMIWHHAIVVDTDVQNKKLHVIHYTKTNKRTQIVKEWINVDKQKGDLFRFNYSAETVEQNPPEDVVQRALERVGETGYNLLKKNCEHFATDCKTGRGYSAQVGWAWGKTKEALHAGAGNVMRAGTRLGCAIVKEVSKETSKSVAESAGKVGAAELTERVAKGTNWVGAGLVAGIEAAHCAHDVYHIHKDYKAGKMKLQDFQRTTTQRVSEGVIGGSSAIGASILGECVGGLIGGVIGSAVPVVGTAIGTAAGAFVGSVVLGAAGSFAGKALGSIIGRWLGTIFW